MKPNVQRFGNNTLSTYHMVVHTQRLLPAVSHKFPVFISSKIKTFAHMMAVSLYGR